MAANEEAKKIREHLKGFIESMTESKSMLDISEGSGISLAAVYRGVNKMQSDGTILVKGVNKNFARLFIGA